MNVVSVKKHEKLRIQKLVEAGWEPFCVDISHVWLWTKVWKKDK